MNQCGRAPTLRDLDGYHFATSCRACGDQHGAAWYSQYSDRKLHLVVADIINHVSSNPAMTRNLATPWTRSFNGSEGQQLPAPVEQP